MIDMAIWYIPPLNSQRFMYEKIPGKGRVPLRINGATIKKQSKRRRMLFRINLLIKNGRLESKVINFVIIDITNKIIPFTSSCL